MKLNRKKIKEAMMLKCLTVTGLAQVSKVSTATINLIINHDRKPNLKTIGKLARALEVDPAEIVKE